MRGRSPIIILGLGLLVAWCASYWPRPVPRISGAMPQEAYVWQRIWNEPVVTAIARSAPALERFTVLVAEISWRQGQPKLTRVEPDWAALKTSGKSVGLAIRIGSHDGPFERDGKFTRSLAELASSWVAQARAQGVTAAEVQLDFDCAESKLTGYRVWVEAVRARVNPVPLTITALPSWLDRQEFRALVQATDGFVLQVHALQRPQTMHESVQLCDPLAARRWVEAAASTGVPFKVALPTYSYLMAFARDGRFIGASAEGPVRDWLPDVHRRELAAEPKELAALVAHWTTNRPAALQGVIWYRLPVTTDRWNWDWPTLAQVMQGQPPETRWHVVTRSPEPGLVEVLLANASAAKGIPKQTVRVQWQQGRLISGDSLNGNELNEPAARMAEFKPGQTVRALAPGETRLLGWLRFDSSVEVHSELVAQ